MKAYTMSWRSVCRPVFIALAVCLVAAASVIADTAPKVQIDKATILIDADNQPILRYRYGDVHFKPYIKELFTPAGVNILLDSPPDHVHHRGLMFAIGINGIDFWGETQTPACGVQKHMAIGSYGTEQHLTFATAHFSEIVNWIGPESDKPLLKEKRTITAGRTETGDATLVTWQSQFTLAEGIDAVKIDGRHYFGLGMRFIRAMDATGTFLNGDNAEAKTYRGTEKLLRSRWCAYTVKIEGKPVTVAMFDAPKNPRHPAMWFIMKKPFAYLSATLGLHEKPLDLKQGDQLNLRYAVVLWDAEIKPEKIEATYKQWIKRKDRSK